MKKQYVTTCQTAIRDIIYGKPQYVGGKCVIQLALWIFTHRFKIGSLGFHFNPSCRVLTHSFHNRYISDLLLSPSPRLAESSADQDSPDVTTPPRKEPSAAPSQDDTSASDGASASFSPIEDEDSSEARSRTDKSKQKQAKSPASSKSPLKQKLKDQPLSRPSSASESSVSGSPFICDNENGSSSQPSKLVKAEALKTVEVGDEESSSASDAVVATVKASLRPIIVDENSTGSGIASSGIESDLSSTSSPKVISVDLDDGDNLASKSNLHNVVSFSIASESAEKETASSSTKSPVVAEAVSHQGLSKTPVGSAFNHLIEDALAKTAVKDVSRSICIFA